MVWEHVLWLGVRGFTKLAATPIDTIKAWLILFMVFPIFWFKLGLVPSYTFRMIYRTRDSGPQDPANDAHVPTSSAAVVDPGKYALH